MGVPGRIHGLTWAKVTGKVAKRVRHWSGRRRARPGAPGRASPGPAGLAELGPGVGQVALGALGALAQLGAGFLQDGVSVRTTP